MKNATKWMRQAVQLVMVGLLIGVTSACQKDDPMPDPQTITDIVLQNNDFTILRAAVVHAGLADALRSGSLTVFAPTDDAFRASGFANAAAVTALPAATVKTVLEYHVLGSKVSASQIAQGTNTSVATLAGLNAFITRLTPTSGVSVNNARVVTADVMADNGVIHVVDRVLLPPTQNLLQIAQGNPSFTYLVAAATRAATVAPIVVAALTSTTDAYTVFAPTNDAFIAAGFPTIAAINEASPNLLAAVVLYHVLPGRAFSPTLSAGPVASAAGGNLTLALTNGVSVTGTGNNNQASRVVQADIVATNGVIHVIDRVLLP
jgi:uncharacterized surface protein with fasciclin (FAS1) repeats